MLRAGSMPSTGTPRRPGSTAAGSRRCWRSRPRGCRGRVARSRQPAVRDELAACASMRVGERREVEVVAEQLLRRHGLGDLHQRAGRAEDEVERDSVGSGSASCSARQQRVRQRRRAERRGPARSCGAPHERQARSAHRGPARNSRYQAIVRAQALVEREQRRPAELRRAPWPALRYWCADLVARLVAHVGLERRDSIRREDPSHELQHRDLHLVREVERLARAAPGRRPASRPAAGTRAAPSST